jgi:hypothetical protein
MPKKSNQIKWDDLNERQQKTLEAIFDYDETLNRYYRSTQWMSYNTAFSGLKGTLSLRKLVDAGTGATFKALETRGLIGCRYDPKSDFKILELKITRAGRTLVVNATGKTSNADNLDTKKLPKGTLRRWHWDALARAVAAGEEGLQGDLGRYGNIGWNTWLRLRDYYGLEKGLIEEFQHVYKDYRLRVSAAGRKYYRENWQKYREMYPDISAPEPKVEE